MAAIYDADNGGETTWPRSTRHLSIRDLSKLVPVNFVQHLTVSISEVCFATKIYDIDAANKCFSNILAASYRRLIIDLYWDFGLQRLSFCPVLLPDTTTTGPSATIPVSPSTTDSLTTADIDVSQPSEVRINQSHGQTTELAGSETASNNERRQTDMVSSKSQGSGLDAATRSSSSGSANTSVSSTDSLLYDLGAFKCSGDLDLTYLMSLLRKYLSTTENTLQANIIYLGLKLHVAAPANYTDHRIASLSETSLPPQNYTSSQLIDGLRQFIYPAAQLFKERENLNRSWYYVERERYPISEYFATDINSEDIHSTLDGWPCEDYIEMNKNKRLLVNWESIDPQLADYDITPDDAVIFRPDYLSNAARVSASKDGILDSGCFYKAGTTDLASVNSSWAFEDVAMTLGTGSDPSLSTLTALSANLTSCGISPLLNQSLSSTSVGVDSSKYQTFSDSMIWNWASDEPRNSTTKSNSSSTTSRSNSDFRCAVIDVRPDYSGRWRVATCTTQYHAACRVGNQPYLWQLSTSTVSFADAPNACPANTTFAAPRTALENTYLYHSLLNLPRSQIDPASPSPSSKTAAVWVDFNSLAVETCWVTGGPKQRCPYNDDMDEQRTVLVPTIAAIIALTLTALTLFVKCNVNRRMSRRRKRGEGGWDYEGVPS